MKLQTVALGAVFINFFGFYIVRFYVGFSGLPLISPFDWNKYSAQSIVEMVLVFFCCVAITFRLSKNKFELDRCAEYRYRKGYFYWVCSILFFALGFYYLISSNYSLDMSSRGVGQFQRSTMSSLSRVIILALPIFVFYRVAYARFASAKVLSLFFVSSITIFSLSNGDRRLLLYFLLSYIFILAREVNRRVGNKPSTGGLKRFILVSCGGAVLIAAYYFRSGSAAFPGYLVLQSTLGALGVGAILAEVKSIVDVNTGYLMGQSFLTYAWTLFVPSFFLYLFGGDEFVFRSAYEFNKIFNDNPDMGYDFMMLADFYWNFGYAGYFLFVVFYFFVVRYLARWGRGGDDFKLSLIHI